jgi:hypothetical protein
VCDSISIEERKTPTVLLVNDGFIIDATSASSNQGMPKMRVVPESVPCECSVYEEIESNINTVMDDVVAALTRPLSDDEKSPQNKAPVETARIVFSGAPEEVNRFFYRQGWGDGLPLAPPTEEAVKEMLTGTKTTKRVVLSTKLPSADCRFLPVNISPSQ